MLEINFSKNGEGKIFLSTNGTSIRLIECKNDKVKLGEYGTSEDEGEIIAQLNFNRVESVEVFLKHLLVVMEHLENRDNLALGC